MALNVAVDFDQNDWVALYSGNSDAANLIGALAVKPSDIKRQPVGTGGSAAAGAEFPRYAHERVLYGKDRINWTTGTTTNCYINIGYNGSAFEAGLQSLPAGTYTISLYAKLATGSSSDTFSIVLTNATSANYAVGAGTALNSTTWTRLTVSGVTPSTQNLCVQVYRQTGSTSKVVEIAAVMLVAGGTMPTYFNCGSASLLEPVTAYAEETGWDLGFKAAYQYIPPLGRASVKLNNDSKRFSPEYSSSPLYPDLVPGLLVQIADPSYGIKWTGWTESWSPTPGATGPRDCVLKATDARVYLDSSMQLVGLLEALSVELIVSGLVDEVEVPNSTAGIPTSDGIDTVNLEALPSSAVVAYYGDAQTEGASTGDILAEAVGGIQGKLWLNRRGQYMFYASQGDDTPASYVNIGANWMTAVYGDAPIINECNVSVFPRKVSGSAVTLWELDETIVLSAGTSETFRATFRNTTTDKILVGALPTGMSISHTASGGSTTSALSEVTAQSAKVTFNNASAGSRTILTSSITGTRIVALREIFKVYEDAVSKGLYGLMAESLRFSWMQVRSWAAKLAKYRVERFKNPRKVMTQIKLNAALMPSEVHQLNIGRAVYVTDDQTAHAGYYFVVGESHSAKVGMSDHVVTLYLEPLYPTTVEATSV